MLLNEISQTQKLANERLLEVLSHSSLISQEVKSVQPGLGVIYGTKVQDGQLEVNDSASI